jgi:hypothetical protein
MNAFERHGITHLSASSINLYAAQPALWVMQRLLKKSGPVGAAAHRGTAAETGIVHGLLNPAAPIEECQAAALAQYDSLTALSGDPKRVKERDAVPAIVATALPELRGYGIPDEVQHRIEVTLPDVPVPFLGFVDLGWSSHGITLDIKSTLRLPSTISTAHARQVGIYLHGTNREGRVAYCTPGKIGVYRLEDAGTHVAAVANIAKRLERFLAVSNDAAELAAMLVPDIDHFYLNEPITRALVREVYGL